MTLLEEIYCDVVVALAVAGAENDRSVCANELRAIRNRLESIVSAHVISEASHRARILAKSE